MMINEQTTRHEQWDYPSEQQPSENIQFGYHSTTGERIQITSDRLGAERVDWVFNLIRSQSLTCLS